LRPQFTREQISQLDLEEEHVQKAMEALPVAANGWTASTDIQSIFFRLTIDSATEFLFGESVESQMGALHGLNRPEDKFASYFDRSQWVAAQRARFEKLSWMVNNKETRHSDKQVHDFVDKFVNNALAAAKTAGEKAPVDEEKSTRYVFLDALVSMTHDPIELRSQLLNILLAGRDTTASLLSWTFLMLARHPEVFRKLRKTIISEFGTYSSPRNITFATLKSCQYLQYCMNETLRLYPVVPFNRRSATRDTSLPRGGGPDGLSPIFIRKGQHVLYSTHVMHHRKDLWGPDAEEFKPERWASRKAGWEYIPFNGGPRICIGQQFALTEAGYVLVRLLQRFDQIEDVYPDRQIRCGMTLTSSPAEVVTVRLHEATEASVGN
jgi:cytochrome P450